MMVLLLDKKLKYELFLSILNLNFKFLCKNQKKTRKLVFLALYVAF